MRVLYLVTRRCLIPFQDTILGLQKLTGGALAAKWGTGACLYRLELRTVPLTNGQSIVLFQRAYPLPLNVAKSPRSSCCHTSILIILHRCQHYKAHYMPACKAVIVRLIFQSFLGSQSPSGMTHAL